MKYQYYSHILYTLTHMCFIHTYIIPCTYGIVSADIRYEVARTLPFSCPLYNGTDILVGARGGSGDMNKYEYGSIS